MAQPQSRVLVITAIHSIYTLIQRPLKAQGFHTTHAISYDKAQTCLEDETHHLIILDLTHARQEQIDDYDRLRQHTTIPLIVLINGDSGQHNGTITDIVIDDYLYYPFDTNDLLTRVRNALQPRQTHATQRLDLHLGATTIHLDERRAMCNGQKVHLTRTEWKLLEILVLHQGKTLTYRTLLQQVWGDAYHDEHSYVHTYVSQLRHKLEPDPAKPCYLLTEVGVGYRLEASTNGTEPPEHPVATDSPPEEITETPWKLTIPPTTLFGRETDTKAIQHLFRQADVRLLTLTGPPGVGKTRLAQHIAETIQHRFTDGLYIVSLAPLRDHLLVISAIAQTVGAKESAHQTLHQALMQTLKGQQALLFLDNFEHVLEAAPLITELIAIAPDLTILVTSRTPLRIAGEQEYPVPPLTTPDSTIPASPETLAHNPAVALFVRRSQAVKPDFTLRDENAPAVTAICMRLDGLPLAIELAAARSKLFSPQALLARLDHRLVLLSHNTIDMPERHQTLRDAIDWSYQLLQPEEQRILVGLSVFAGGCTLEAATSVLNNDRQLLPEPPLSTTSLSPDPRTLTIINHLTTLVDHSLVQVKEDINNEPRFILLETIREYAWEKLGNNSNEMERVQRMFVEYYLQMVEKAAPELEGPQQQWWIVYLNQELNNISLLLQQSIHMHNYEIVLRINIALWKFWLICGYASEGRKWIENVPIDKIKTSHLNKAKLFNVAGALSHSQGDFEHANLYFSKSLQIFRNLDAEQSVSRILNNLGIVSMDQGNYTQAVISFEESLEIAKRLHDQYNTANILNNLGLVMLERGEYFFAKTSFEKSLVARDNIDDDRKALALVNIGRTEILLRNYKQAIDFITKGQELYQLLESKMGIGFALHHLGRCMYYQNQYKQATKCLDKSLLLFEEIQNKHGIADVLNILGKIALDQRDIEKAFQLLRRGLSIQQIIQMKSGIASCIENIAMGMVFMERWIEAIHLYSSGSALRLSVGVPIPIIDQSHHKQLLTITQEQLDESIWQQAWDEGQKMSLEETIDYALKHVVSDERAVAS